MSNFTFIDLFAGIGGMRLGFEDAGGKCVFSSEKDKFARMTYAANFGDIPRGDITEVPNQDIPAHDVLLGGFPCQPFSLAGVSKNNSLGRSHGFGHKTQGTMFFEIERILTHCQPKAFLLENVKNLKGHDRGRTFGTILEILTDKKGLNYKVFSDVIDGSYFVPQHRERTYIVGFRDHDVPFGFPMLDAPINQIPLEGFDALYGNVPEEPVTLRSDVMEGEVDPKYHLSSSLWDYLQGHADKHKNKGNGFGFGLIDPFDPDNKYVKTRTLSARYYKDGSEILIDTGKSTPRRLTPRECARLMGFPDSFSIPVSDAQAYKQFGNSVVVPLVTLLAHKISKSL